jgi:protein-S-isoprenylcysteine O-methyltransferase Ste14
MTSRLVRAVLTLPVGAILVPALILLTWERPAFASGATATPTFWIGLAAAVGGVTLALWAGGLLIREPHSPSALVDARGRLTVRGPYRYLRNPLVSAGLMLIVAAALICDSQPLAIWLAVYFFINAIYVPRVEERALEQRFGDAWRHYKAHVPRWFPSPLAYEPDAGHRDSGEGIG